ncbi:MAG: tetratricopeptide repeat protein [Myxococcales bacterium]|nr:tetratricopeptide repeat protein [Myxococcales bacterium]
MDLPVPTDDHSERGPLPALAMAVVLLGPLLLYGAALSHPFLFDDGSAIVNNPQVRILWPLVDAMSPAPNGPTSGRPLVALSFSINYALGGLAVEGYRLVNIALHAVNALLLHGFLLQLLTGPGVAAWVSRSARVLAFAMALLWSVHPLLSECIVYVTQRTELLGAFFYLLTLALALRHFREPGRPIFGFGAVAAAIAGLGAKETVTTVALAVLLLDRATGAPSWAQALRRHRGLYVGLGIQVAIAAAMVANQPYDRAGIGLDLGVSAIENLATQGGVIAHYLKLAFWPQPLSISYHWPIAKNLLLYGPGLALVSLLGVGAIGVFVRRGLLGFPALLFFVLLAPSSSVLPMVTEVVAERRMYLPLAVVIVYVVLLVQAVAVRWLRSRSLRRAVLSVGLGVVVLAAGARTLARLDDYGSRLRIWQSAWQADPQDPQATSAYARELYDAGQRQRARSLLEPLTSRRRQVHGEADWAGRAHIRLSDFDMREGKHESALQHRLAAATTSPHDPTVQVEIARALLVLGRKGEALTRLQALVQGPDANAVILNEYGATLIELKRPGEAIGHLVEALRLQPGSVEALLNLGVAFVLVGDLPMAMRAFRDATAREPDSSAAWRQLGLAQHRAGQYRQALESMDATLALDPKQPEVLGLRCGTLANLGQPEQGLASCRKAVELSGGEARFREQSAQVEAMIEKGSPGAP